MRWDELQRQLAVIGQQHAQATALANNPADANRAAYVQSANDAVAARDRLTAAYHAANRPSHAPAAPAPPPPPPPPPPGQYRTSSVKIPEINIINFKADVVPSKQIEKMYFQDVGGTEILSVARHNTVGGEEVVYSHVDNLADIKSQFNPLNVLMSTNMEDLFNKYAIDIHQKMPQSLETSIATVESETQAGVWNIEILVENVNTDEYIQIQIAKTVDEFDL